jgi:hypothetical protein
MISIRRCCALARVNARAETAAAATKRAPFAGWAGVNSLMSSPPKMCDRASIHDIDLAV